MPDITNTTGVSAGRVPSLVVRREVINFARIGLGSDVNLTENGLKLYGERLLSSIITSAGNSKVVILGLNDIGGIDPNGVRFLQRLQTQLRFHRKGLVIQCSDNPLVLATLEQSAGSLNYVISDEKEAMALATRLSRTNGQAA